MWTQMFHQCHQSTKLHWESLASYRLVQQSASCGDQEKLGCSGRIRAISPHFHVNSIERHRGTGIGPRIYAATRVYYGLR
jgi:hypothetical protein